jgi:hypothetical protein
VKVLYKNRNVKKLLFDDLDVTDTFRVVNGSTVYAKVQMVPRSVFGQEFGAMELSTGRVFMGPQSEVELVDVEVSIND